MAKSITMNLKMLVADFVVILVRRIGRNILVIGDNMVKIHRKTLEVFCKNLKENETVIGSDGEVRYAIGREGEYLIIEQLGEK